MTGLNWAQQPAVIVEMGFMTNPSEDKKMTTDSYQILLVQGMADGIDEYFNLEKISLKNQYIFRKGQKPG